MIGAFLQNNGLSTDNSWYHPSLRYACDWLQQNNPYLSAYHSIASHLFAHNSQTSPTVWPQATQVSDSNSEFVKRKLFHKECLTRKIRMAEILY